MVQIDLTAAVPIIYALIALASWVGLSAVLVRKPDFQGDGASAIGLAIFPSIIWPVALVGLGIWVAVRPRRGKSS